MDRIWGIWGSYYNIPKAIFYLLKGDYTKIGLRDYGLLLLTSRAQGSGLRVFGFHWAQGLGISVHLALQYASSHNYGCAT